MTKESQLFLLERGINPLMVDRMRRDNGFMSVDYAIRTGVFNEENVIYLPRKMTGKLSDFSKESLIELQGHIERYLDGKNDVEFSFMVNP